MRLADLLKLKDARWFRLVMPGGYCIGDALQRDIRERKAEGSKHEAAEEGQIDAARHLQKRVEIADRGEATGPAGKTSATTTAKHVQGIKNCAVADEVKHCVIRLASAMCLDRSGCSTSTRCACSMLAPLDAEVG
jgi:hypothetical protein